MQIDWDPEKNESNQNKHGLNFEDAAEVFSGPVLVVEDRRKDYGEHRYNALGMLDDLVVSIVFTPRNDGLRIISMRRANKKERQAYEAHQE